MANFDIAVGITQTGLNNALSSLFQNPTLQTKFFDQHFSEEVSGITVDVDIVIKSAPTVTLAPPSVAKWQASFGADGKQQTGQPPAGNIFQVIVPDLSVTGTIAGVQANGEGVVEVYAEITLTNNVVNITGLSVWIDESGWENKGFTKLIVNGLIIPYALTTVNQMLNAIPFPQIPTNYTTTGFQNPMLGITNANELVLATSLSTSPATSLDGYTPPASQDIYLQAGLVLINNVLTKELANYALAKTATTGDSAANASVSIKGTVKSVQLLINGQSTVANVNIADITGYGELGGVVTAVAKTVLCPVGTAIDAISNPSTWDKVISNFDITYSPDPLGIPFTVNVTSSESVTVSIGHIDSIKIIAAPTWSGVIGSTLAALAAGFVDFVSVTFGTDIVNGILHDKAQNIEVFQNASVSTQLEGVNITLSAAQGAALLPQGNSYIVEGFTISFS